MLHISLKYDIQKSKSVIYILRSRLKHSKFNKKNKTIGFIKMIINHDSSYHLKMYLI